VTQFLQVFSEYLFCSTSFNITFHAFYPFSVQMAFVLKFLEFAIKLTIAAAYTEATGCGKEGKAYDIECCSH